MIVIATIWGIITVLAMLYGIVEPILNRKDNQSRFNNYK
jgi:hypothetical protein